jgi:hypothetical protein
MTPVCGNCAWYKPLPREPGQGCCRLNAATPGHGYPAVTAHNGCPSHLPPTSRPPSQPAQAEARHG